MASEGVQDPARQLPHDEIVQRYESGELVSDLCEGLVELGFQVSAQEVEAVLDACCVIRHAHPFEVPESAPRGFPVSELPRIPPRRPDEDVHRVFDALTEGQEKRNSQPSDKSLHFNDFFTEERLARIASRHDGGKGDSLSSMATGLGVDQTVLAWKLREAGYPASTRNDWIQQELKRLTPEIVALWQSEDATLESIVDFLREEHEVFVSLTRVVRLLRKEGLAVSAKQPRKQRVARGPAASTALNDGQNPVSSTRRAPAWILGPVSDERWKKIAGHEAEMARRILDCEATVRQIAKEFEVDPNWLAQTLRKMGHLPEVNLSRLLAQRRAELAKNV